MNIDDHSRNAYKAKSDEGSSPISHIALDSHFAYAGTSWLDTFFALLTLAILAFVLYQIWTNVRNTNSTSASGTSAGGGGGGGGNGGGWFSRSPRPRFDPPPPYTPHAPKPSSSRAQQDMSSGSSSWGYNPTFLNGLGMGALSGYLAGRYMGTTPRASSSRTQEELDRDRDRARVRERDRERDWLRSRTGIARTDHEDDEWEEVPRATASRGFFSSDRFGRGSDSGPDSGAGAGSASNHGAMRSSTGYGVTKSR